MVIVPYQNLSPEALQGLIEDFVTRPGTDSGYTGASLEQNVARVKSQLRSGEALITFDPVTGTANIISAREAGSSPQGDRPQDKQ